VQAIAAAHLSIGTGRGVHSLLGLTKEEAHPFDLLYDYTEPTEEAIVAFKDACKGFLSSALEFATFNFFWEDVPIFLLRELYRSRFVSPAEQSLRFATVGAGMAERFSMGYAPSILSEWQEEYQNDLAAQILIYRKWLERGATPQDARNLLGVWVLTHTTTTMSYRALRDVLAVRQTSQAHPAWQDVVKQIKSLMWSIHPVLEEELRDICDIQGRCVWQSSLDRPCSACEQRRERSREGEPGEESADVRYTTP
jgi:thymidylate synthase ThyX